MRDLTQIKDQFISNLILQNSPLTDFTPGSVNSTLIRSIAAVQLEQDVLLEDLKNQMYLNTSDGTYLDSKLKDFGLIRKQATFANGFILMKPNSITNALALNTILLNPVSGNQYQVTSGLRSINNEGEQSYAIQALDSGKEYNVNVNTKLVLATDPSLYIVVGRIRTTEGVVQEGISNGFNRETDNEFIRRFISTTTGTRFSTTAAIKSFILNQSNITFVSIDNPFPGHLIIWFESSITFTNVNLLNLRAVIQEELPAGISFDLKPIQKQLLTINLRINNNVINKDRVTSKLINDVDNWNNTLNVNETFEADSLLNYLNSVNFGLIPEITYLTEISNIVPAADTLISINNVTLTFGT